MIPAAVRRKLGFKSGHRLNVRVEPYRLIFEDPQVALQALQDYFKPFHWKPGEKMLSEELIEERRAEALREMSDASA